MARAREHLQNAPIVEAVIDFRVVRDEHVSPETFAGLGPSIGKQYTQEDLIQSIHARFGVDHGKFQEPLQMQTDLGWRYQAGTEVAQYRVDGFTFSKIEQYETWEKVSEGAFRLWGIYVDVAKPRQVSRVAVRYINRMRLPATSDLSRYLEAPPRIPEPAPQAIREFLTRLVVNDEKRKVSAMVVLALEPQTSPDEISLFLDIDAFCEVKEQPKDPGLSAVFEQLRRLKNDIFFASITEEIVEKYA